MSILDKISESSENKDLDKKSLDFKAIINRHSADGMNFLCALGENSPRIITGTTKDGEIISIQLRMLTTIEEIKLNTFVEEFRRILPVKVHEGHKALADISLVASIKLMMATTPKLPVTATLAEYNVNAKICVMDFLVAESERVALVLKEYESLENEFNPKINDIDQEEVQELVEWVKKPGALLSRLTYEQSLTVLNHFLEQKELEDRL